MIAFFGLNQPQLACSTDFMFPNIIKIAPFRLVALGVVECMLMITEDMHDEKICSQFLPITFLLMALFNSTLPFPSIRPGFEPTWQPRHQPPYPSS
jgi:hypothetical protein